MSSLDVRAIDAADLKKEKAPAVKAEFRVFLTEEAFDRTVERGNADTTREIGGVLVGNVYKDDAGPYLRIDTTIDALHADEKGAELTFTHDTWDHINKEMDTKYKDKKVVGWYHTHPGFSVFLSDRDQFIQNSFFNLPFQVAFVYDPKSREHGMFTWHDNEIRRARRYWVGSKEQNWDGNRTNGAPEKKDVERKDKEEGKSGGTAEEPFFGDGWGAVLSMALFGVMLLMIGGFLGNCYGQQKVGQVAEEADKQIRNAKVAGQEIAISSLQSDLVNVLRSVMGDDALHKPVQDEITKLDALLKDLDAPPQPGVDQTKRLKDTIAQLREQLLALAEDRSSAERTLNNLAARTEQVQMFKLELAQDVAEHRTAIGQLYAEMAADAAKSGDKARATRLLSTAAQVDPGNAGRYQQQLQTFDKGGSLPKSDTPPPPPPQLPAPAPAPAATGSGATASAGSGGVK